MFTGYSVGSILAGGRRAVRSAAARCRTGISAGTTVFAGSRLPAAGPMLDRGGLIGFSTPCTSGR